MVDDPAFITHFNWSELSKLLIFLWLLLIAAVGFAGSILVAHGLIPSLAASRELPDQRLLKLRPLLYGAAAVFLAGAGVIVRLLVSKADVFEDIYARWWI